MTILFAESDFWTDDIAFREKYARVIREAYADVKQLLPKVPDQVTFLNQVAPWECMKEYGQGAFIQNSRLVIISIDDSLPHGEEKLLEYTRQAIFHELNHAVRFEKSLFHRTFLEQCVLEGLATVFEREYLDDAMVLYGEYEDEPITDWLDEILELGDEVDSYQYKFTHDDGRKWIGYKVGTYIVDEAIKKSGKSILKLTNLQASTILELAGVPNGT